MLLEAAQMGILRAARSLFLIGADYQVEGVFLYLKHVLGLKTVRGMLGGKAPGEKRYGYPCIPFDNDQMEACGIFIEQDDTSGNAVIVLDDAALRAMRLAYADWADTFLSNSTNVILYGMGWNAHTFLHAYSQDRPRILRVVVSQLSSARTGFANTSVEIIYDVEPSTEPVLVAADERTHSAIMNTLSECGFHNVIPLTFELLSIWMRRITNAFVQDSGASLLNSPFGRGEFLFYPASATKIPQLFDAPHWLFGSRVTAYWNEAEKLLTDLHLPICQERVYGALHSLKPSLRKLSGNTHTNQIQPYMYMAQRPSDRPMCGGPLPELYAVLNVGAALSDSKIEGFRDDVGENISSKNGLYSEMTGVYWLWKNAPETRFLGLCHYNRHFALSAEELLRLVDSNIDIVAPTMPINFPCNRELFIRSGFLTDEFCTLLEDVVQELEPACKDDLMSVLEAPILASWNMFIMRWDWFGKYCSWLFPLCKELERRGEAMNLLTSRCMGYVTELLFSVFLAQHRYRAKIALVDRVSYN